MPMLLVISSVGGGLFVRGGAVPAGWDCEGGLSVRAGAVPAGWDCESGIDARSKKRRRGGSLRGGRFRVEFSRGASAVQAAGHKAGKAHKEHQHQDRRRGQQPQAMRAGGAIFHRCRAAATRSRACRSWFWPRSRASVASTWAIATASGRGAPAARPPGRRGRPPRARTLPAPHAMPPRPPPRGGFAPGPPARRPPPRPHSSGRPAGRGGAGTRPPPHRPAVRCSATSGRLPAPCLEPVQQTLAQPLPTGPPAPGGRATRAAAPNPAPE